MAYADVFHLQVCQGKKTNLSFVASQAIIGTSSCCHRSEHWTITDFHI